ncbi:hypothetical protein TWF694_006840 [Orbilia ellipsospora]|uniref:Glycosyl transferase family 25 domain-containing protein n=1 Tax=Orbilia ellipsospora TaxID=2528407 RepID=A0AAV9XN07_9PEZI
MLNRRITVALLACVVLPFLFVSLNHFHSSASGTLIPHDTTNVHRPPAVPVQNPPKDNPPPKQNQPPSPPSSKKEEFSDIEFNKGQGGDKQQVPDEPVVHAIPNDDVVAQVRNETLGFGAIILISLKIRTDRQDAVSLIASEAGIKITHVIDAVKGEDIHQKAYPYGTARTDLPLPYLGSWRSHMDAFKYIIDNRIETALVLEDDIDWDIYVKDQLTSLSNALRSNPLRKPFTTDELKRAPYGLDWDVMHLGTSKNLMAPPPYNNLFHRYDDAFTTPRHLTQRDSPCGDRDFFCWNDIIQQTRSGDKQRVIFPSYQPVGLVSLAVSFKGAQKMVYDLSWKALDTSMDFGVRNGCERGFLKGWSVAPPIMSSWRVKGSGDSDLRNGGKGAGGVGAGNMKGEGQGLGWSARKALQNQFEGYNYWKDGTIGWFGTEKAPVPDNSYVRAPPTEHHLADHEKNKANRKLPETNDDDDSFHATPPMGASVEGNKEQPKGQQQPPSQNQRADGDSFARRRRRR